MKSSATEMSQLTESDSCASETEQETVFYPKSGQIIVVDLS
jgi:hypothetical protein